MCCGFDVGTLLSGGYFTAGGHLDISQGALLQDRGYASTQAPGLSVTLGHLSVADGTYMLEGNAHIQVSTGIDVGCSDTPGRFEWQSEGGGINMSGSPMNVLHSGTLSMGFDFSDDDLLTGGLFEDPNDTLDMSDGRLEVAAGVTGTQTNQGASFGAMSVLGTYRLEGAVGLSVQRNIYIANGAKFEWLNQAAGIASIIRS